MKRINKRKLISIIIVVVAVIFIVTGIFVYKKVTYKHKSNKELSKINSLIDNENYKDAYNKIKKDKKNKYGDKDKLNDKLKELKNKENEAYKNCLKMLSSDDETFSKTISALKDYLSKYEYSDNAKSAKELLDLIQNYNNKLSEYNNAKTIADSYKGNVNLLNTIISYEGSVDAFHGVIAGCTSAKSPSDVKSAYYYWNSNSGYLYSMNGNLQSMKQSIPNCIFTDSDIKAVEAFINNGIVPGECINEVASTREYSDSVYDRFFDSWSKYSSLKSQVDSIISTKQNEISSRNVDVTPFLNEVNDIKNKILSYNK